MYLLVTKRVADISISVSKSWTYWNLFASKIVKTIIWSSLMTRVVNNHCSIQFLTPYPVLASVQSCVITKNNLELTSPPTPAEWIFNCYYARCVYGECVRIPWTVIWVTCSNYNPEVKESTQQRQMSKIRIQSLTLSQSQGFPITCMETLMLKYYSS